MLLAYIPGLAFFFAAGLITYFIMGDYECSHRAEWAALSVALFSPLWPLFAPVILMSLAYLLYRVMRTGVLKYIVYTRQVMSGEYEGRPGRYIY